VTSSGSTLTIKLIRNTRIEDYRFRLYNLGSIMSQVQYMESILIIS